MRTMATMSQPMRHEEADAGGRRVEYRGIDWSRPEHLAWLVADLCPLAESSPASDLAWWVEAPLETLEVADRVAGDAGFARTRTLVQLRRPLPMDAPPDLPGLRTFDPERDVDAWLALNNAAFSWHPDQGHQNRNGVAVGLAAPWVDLNGFFVVDAADGDGLDGFCWTRFHPATQGDTPEPPLGEVYVIATAKRARGRGLGRALVEVGMDHQYRVRGARQAMLWTEADNDGALALYDRLGYVVHHGNARYAPRSRT